MRKATPEEVVAIPPVPMCPACRASNVTTTSKTVSAETYWRCVSCGEVWNVARRETSNSRGSGRWPDGGRWRGGYR
jgi:transposase-like protein